jgi:hypothetical protein
LSRDPIGEEGGMNLYAYVVNSPLNSIDPTGLTQCDIDIAREIAENTQPDLTFPDQYGIADFGKNAGVTIPGYGTSLNSAYLNRLSDTKANDLLNTIIHEGIHYSYPANDWRQKEDGYKHTGYPYEEADRRTTPQICNKFNQERKKRCGR